MIEAGILILLCAVLNRIAGKGGFPQAKLLRRIGIPLLITLYGLWRHQWLSLLSLPYGFAIFCLPITLVGDEILTDGRTKLGFEKKGKLEISFFISFPTKWINLAWLPVLGFLIGLLTISLWKAVIYSVIYTTIVVLSNVKPTAKFFTWDRCEYAFGGILGILI